MDNIKKYNGKRLTVKLFLCLIYVVIITVLFVCSYKLYEEKINVKTWDEVESVEDYTYVTIHKMSEKFAYYEETNVGIHFIIEKEPTGQWHTFLIAIDEDEYDEYKDIIDYTYERTKKIPKPKKVYGYPVIASNELKSLAIKNIENFVPAENEVKISEENYDAYLTNSYLDTTKDRVDKFNFYLFAVLFLLVTVIFLLITTIIYKDRLIDKVDEKLLEEIRKTKIIIRRKKNR